MKIVWFILVLLIGLVIFVACNKITFEKKVEVSASEFMAKLDELGYFKYTDDKNLDRVKQSVVEGYCPECWIYTEWDEDAEKYLDNRLYMCDNETLFEYGGFTEMLEEVKPTFDKIGLKIIISNHFEEWDDDKDWLNHRITINGTDYTIFKNFKDYGWGEAVARFAQIVNQEAEKQSVDDRIYLAHGGNDGFMIFLSKELYQYIYSVYTDKQVKPLEVGEWMKVMQVKPMSYD